MTDHPNAPKSEQHDTGFVRKNNETQQDMDNEVHRLQQGDNALPEDAGHDFTFPDEQETLGRKTGDDLPGESDPHRD
ncbi:hypothetical protein [Deinococcus maricopensis]|uniref:Uncharacterized protein n=1 Tax=Deinococcus maricopensis (strain DSM 21211 / LMG 22137 / NRRL B-23946 / LB-34) TaxID=709986 RepID=E8U5D2_DEIML|nr:hypothetical protein [Deinococcus maricopensis]ADV66271.1 hypothetical protein Deima_0613 [Deinococcus maricopensis DSM 21211]